MANKAGILTLCGSFIAFYIGAGFATMQEVLQYDASYGSQFWIVILVAAAIYTYTNISFAKNGSKHSIRHGGRIYSHYCGNRIGAFFDYFAAFFCYMSFVVMCGGANSTAMQQFNLPNGVGAALLAFAVIATVLLGLNGIVKALGKIGPLIIICILIIAALSTLSSTIGFSNGTSMIDSGSLPIVQVGNGSPIASGASYGGFVILWFASFMAEVGAKNDVGNVIKGSVLSSFCIFGVASLCCIALISNIDITWSADIPALALAERINPVFSLVFAVVILIGIYTSAVPLLWTGVRKISSDSTVKYRLVTIIGGIAGCAISCCVSYAPLLNILYGLNGYLGFLLIAFMLIRDCKSLFDTIRSNKQTTRMKD